LREIRELQIKVAALEITVSKILEPLREDLSKVRERLIVTENRVCKAWDRLDDIKEKAK
jgi:GTP cyclohydrolase I